MNAEIWLSAAAVLWLPGAALYHAFRRSGGGDCASKIAAQFALSLAFWPILFLWTSLLPLHWTSLAVRSVVALSAAVALFGMRRPRSVRCLTFHSIGLLVILIVTGWTRLRAIAAVVVPPWIDSVHHTMLIRLFLLRGTVPTTYDPFISGATAFYHWGFHSTAAVLCWFLGRTDPFAVARIVLSFGQFLNVLAPLLVYAAALALVRSRTAAVIAAAIAGLVSYYPAYYVSWGRYTHLAGVLLLLGWMALAARARRFTPGHAAILGIVAAGLTLVHVRLAFFAVTFTIILIAAQFIRRRRPVALLAGGAVALIMVLPWLVQMRTIAPKALAPADTDRRWTTPAELRANLLWVPHTAEVLSIATAGLSGMANVGPLTVTARVLSFAWWLSIVIVASKRRRGRPLIAIYVILAGWCAITLLFLNGTHLQFATNTSAAITAFVPMCIAAGALIAWLASRFRRVAAVAVIAICCAIGIATLSNIINPITVIATQADLDALHWFHDATPPSATIVGRVQPWYGGAFIGVDGAYWSSVLADRRSLPPPSLYAWSGSFGEMELFLARWRDEYPFVTHATLDEARHLGITHVYFARGTPAEAPPRVGPIVYAKDGVTIAAVR